MNLGKNRSNFCRWMDRQKEVKKVELTEHLTISSNTISKLRSDPEYRPLYYSTLIKINQGFKKLDKNIDLNNFLLKLL